MHILILSLLAALSPGGTNAAPSPAMRTDTHGCYLIVPADLGSGSVTWIGSCADGRAEGLGVVRVGGLDTPTLFAGTMHAGRPVAGYLDTGSADTAGPSLHFRGADGLPTRNQAEARQACTIAARGATAAATRFRERGNAASARYYTDWAAGLRRCDEDGD